MLTLINLATKEKISESDFRFSMKHVSFPAVLTDDMLSKYGHAILHSSEKPASSEFNSVVEDGSEFVNGKWQVKWREKSRTFKEIIDNHGRLKAIKEELEDIDRRSVRSLRKLVLRRASQADADYLTKLDDRRDELVREMNIIVEAARMVAMS